MTNTAAGVATSVFDICFGTARTTANTARISFIKPARTAVVDGHTTIECVDITTISAGFDITVADLFVGDCLTIGAADAITIQMILTEVWNL